MKSARICGRFNRRNLIFGENAAAIDKNDNIVAVSQVECPSCPLIYQIGIQTLRPHQPHLPFQLEPVTTNPGQFVFKHSALVRKPRMGAQAIFALNSVIGKIADDEETGDRQ